MGQESIEYVMCAHYMDLEAWPPRPILKAT